MTRKETVRAELSNYLENEFIERRHIILKDMKMINTIISTFGGESEYTYDEYCRQKLSLSLSHFDFIDLDLSISEITDRDEGVIHGRAVMRSISDRSIDFQQIKKEEYIKFQADKISSIDLELFSRLYEYSTKKMIWNKIPLSIWKERNKELCKMVVERANLEGERIAKEKRSYHEVWLSQMLFN